MSLINTEPKVTGRAPDIIVSFNYDETIAVAGKPGISYASSVNRRGDHGSFSPTDTRISLLARGPDFKAGLYDMLPTAKADSAPRAAHLCNLTRRAGRARVLGGARRGAPPVTDFSVLPKTRRSSTRTGLTTKLPTDLDGGGIDPRLTTYAVELKTKVLSRSGRSYTYFDHARAIRE